MKHLSFKTTILPALLLFFISCKKEFDLPPVQAAESLNKINIAGIKAKYPVSGSYQFKSDSSLYCIVTADEASGNLFKEVYVKDPTGAIHLRLVNSGGLYTGDSIRINLKGLLLNANNNLIQLDSVDAEKSIVKLASGYNPQPAVLTIQQIIAGTSATSAAQSKLVKIENVEFIAADQNQAYADAVNKSSLSRVIRSCTGQTLSVRTSGYCSFAAKLTPSRNGSISGIVTQFGSTMQLILRNYSDVDMNNALCATSTPTGTAYLSKDFNDNSIGSGGWTSCVVTNSAVSWAISSFSGTPTPFAKISGYVGGTNAASENWYISPPVNLSTAVNPGLSFQTAAKFTGTALDVLISTNYINGAPSTATWTSLAPGFMLSPTSGNYVWTASGIVSLSAYRSANMRIAFKYRSTASAATSYELDDIVVKEN